MSSPPTSSSSALPSPSQCTAPVSSWLAACVILGPGQIQAVPEASRVSTAHASPTVWSQALQRARGPPMLAWCQVNGPYSHCAWRNADCVFEGPQAGSRRDSAVCEACQDKLCQGPLEISRVEVCRLQEEVEGLQEDAWVARQEHDEAAQAQDTLVRDHDVSLELLEAQAEEVKQLRAQLTWEVAGGLTGAPGFVAPSAQEVKAMAWGLHQANESESRRCNWLLREVAAARLETLGWAWEHRLLLDGLSLGVSYVVEELAGQAMTLRVAQGAGRLSRLMEAHRHRSFVETGAWLEA
ncbi:hypothetical protein C0992_011691, partial [Termitomyces sp. T32_za158]